MDAPFDPMKRASRPTLSLVETRVLGVLVEKKHTVPDTYPLTLNALVAGSNQKTSRDPVMEVSESDVQQALDALKARSFVVESSGSRVMRYAHNVERVLAIPPQSVALLATLMLRGPQTAGELRINGDRLHRFADLSAVEGFLRELEARPTGALVAELPRSPGTRETRWRHLLSGDDAIAPENLEPPTAARIPAPDLIALQDAVAALRTDVDALQAAVAALRGDLAIRQDDPER